MIVWLIKLIRKKLVNKQKYKYAGYLLDLEKYVKR